ncbi:S8 family serine peptidase [Paenibacillus sp. R14(2021)]|uniref:S8 family serine peptidase n=1 Tax=Paenibacillus sp. R14(2021) TaxID=2859228 RepID=UPI001C613EC4|nr:S8 family serine peptidase [Paenibacillus sp. R14(2021)]
MPSSPRKSFVSIALALSLALVPVTPVIAGNTAKTEDAYSHQDKLRKSKRPESPMNEGIVQVAKPQESSGASPSVANQAEDVKFSQDRVIVKFKTSVKSVSSLSRSIAGKVESLRLLPGTESSLLKVNKGTAILPLIQELKKDPNVQYAEPDYQVSLAQPATQIPVRSNTGKASQKNEYPEAPAPVIPKYDEEFSEQWALNNTGQELHHGYYEGGTPDIDIDAPEAWAITKGRKEVIVAQIGTGVKIDVPDIRFKIWQNPGEIPFDRKDNDGNGLIDDVNGWDFFHKDNTVFDERDHFNDYFGTFAAGTIAAEFNQGGMAGVAPIVTIMPLKFLANGGGYVSDIVDAIAYAETNGASIANFDWGLRVYSEELYQAIKSSSLLFVSPSGDNDVAQNRDEIKLYPGGFHLDNVLTVTAIDNNGNLKKTSGYGKSSVDIAAPGVTVLATAPDYNIGYGAQISKAADPNDPTKKAYKAIYNGIGFEEVPVGEGYDPNQRQDMFNQAMNYLNDGFGPADQTRVLFVQDEKNPNDGGIFIENEMYKGLLNKAGFTNFDIIEVPDGKVDGPSFTTLKDYDIVIWSTAIADGLADNLLTDADQLALTKFLNGGGHLLLSGQDAIDSIMDSYFVLDMLHIVFMGEGRYGEKGLITGAPHSIYSQKSYYVKDIGIMTDTIISEDPNIAQINLETVQSYYWLQSGTTQAAAITSGTAALILSQFPTMSAADVKTRMNNSGMKLSSLTIKTVSGSMVNAFRALYAHDIPGVPLRDSSVTNRIDASTEPEDVYAIEMGAGEKFTLSLKGDANTDFDLYLYDSSAATVTSKLGMVASSENEGTSSESITYTALETGTYYMNVSAFSGAGSYTLIVKSGNQNGLFQDNHEALTYSGPWQSLSGSSYSGGSSKQLDAAGSVEFGFNGNDIRWIGTLNNKQGIADVYIDGVKVATGSLYSATPKEQQTIFHYAMNNGHHTIKIVWTGKPDPSVKKDGMTAINVDAFIVSNLIFSTAGNASMVGPWMTSYSKNYTRNQQISSDKANSSVEYPFTGTEVTLYANTGKNRGKASIYIDNKLVTTVDIYSPATKYHVPVFSSAVLVNGKHTIKVVNTGERNNQSTGTLVTIDALNIVN